MRYLDREVAQPGKYESPKRGRIDYREVLAPDEFAKYTQLRTLRKELADKEGVPPYALFTNEHLAEMVRQAIKTKKELEALHGVGKGRLDKYGRAFLDVLQTFEVSGKADAPQSSGA